ncbi:MAG TPA: CBS domain-containing protein [Solirubrobacteraceae bacterium]|jgi:CBS domain-containing protein
MKIREVMTESVVTAPPDCPVATIAELMRERNVGSVVLVDGDGTPIGFITDRDLAVSVLADGRDGTDPAEAHASTPVITGEPEMDVHAAAERMVSHGVRRLPIVDGDRIAGILTLDDLAVRTGDLGIAQAMTSELVQAQMPGFYFFDRGG